MQHAAIARREWLTRLRSTVFLRCGPGCVRAVQIAGTSLLLIALLSPSIAGAAAAGHAQQQQRPGGYLGIEFHDLTSEQAAAMHLRDKRGVEVLLVDHDGPAASAGLQPHDLITGLNGRIVASGEALRRMIHDTGAGVEVRLSVFRNGNPITIRTRLANREDLERKAWARLTQPDPEPGMQGAEVTGAHAFGPSASPAPAPSHKSEGFIETMLHGPFTGLAVEAMQPQLAGYFGAPKGQGLLVQSVEAGSPAANAGVHAGDVILTADSRPMHTTSDWSRQLRASKGKPVALGVLRDHQQMTFTFQPGSKK